MSTTTTRRKFVSLGMFIIDEFAFADAAGKPDGRSLSPQVLGFIPRCSHHPAYIFSLFRRSSTFFLQIGGGGTYATIGARVW
jgi:hypothetical protein